MVHFGTDFDICGTLWTVVSRHPIDSAYAEKGREIANNESGIVCFLMLIRDIY